VTGSLEVLGRLSDDALARPAAGATVRFHLYAALRREHAAAVAAGVHGPREPGAILAFANDALGELEALLAGRPAAILEEARDGEWTLRDLLRHAVAVELRYRAQVLWSAGRADGDPLAIPAERLPCDRLAPPEPEYADTRTGGIPRILALLRRARAKTDDALADLSPVDLERPTLWGSYLTDVRDRMHQIGVHLVEVTLQAGKMVGAPGEPEALRVVRRIAAVRATHAARSDAATIAALDARLEEIARAVGVGAGPASS
jgi:hypothetical protein